METNMLIQQFMYEQVPLPEVAEEIKFEALSAEVFGTKQRRFGPMPSPEIQVKIRDVLRTPGRLKFLVPWGASKQDVRDKLDVAEFCALKQLRCLQEGLRRYGRDAKFYFRIEDLTDGFLFGNERNMQIREYSNSLTKLIGVVLPESEPRRESDKVSWDLFYALARDYTDVFYKYLTGATNVDSLQSIGWKGAIPKEQREYYIRQYQIFYPGQDHTQKLAEYFAATLTRVKLKATCSPDEPYLVAAFTHPIPGNPLPTPRLQYRTIAERYTHTHRSPWLAKGVFRMTDYCVTPRFAEGDEKLYKNSIEFGGVNIEADYYME